MRRIKYISLATVALAFSTLDSYNQNVGINGDGATPESGTMLDIKASGSTSATFGLKVKDSDGDEIFSVRSDERVGVRNSSPSANLDVVGGLGLKIARSTANIGGDFFIGNGTGQWSLRSNQISGFDFTINDPVGSSRFYIDASGNVGVGLTSLTTSLFEVAGGITATNGIFWQRGNNPIWRAFESDGTADNRYWEWFVNGDAMIGRILNDAYTVASTFMEVERAGTVVDEVNFPNGNVGVGTSTPGAKLSVYSTAGNFDNLMSFQSGVGTRWDLGVFNTGGAALIFEENGNNNLVLRKSTGLIGVGTDSPVVSVGKGIHIQGSTGDAVIRLESTSASGGDAWEWRSRVQSGLAAIDFRDITTGITAMTMNENGYVGIGETNITFPFMVGNNTTNIALVQLSNTNTAGGSAIQYRASTGSSNPFTYIGGLNSTYPTWGALQANSAVMVAHTGMTNGINIGTIDLADVKIWTDQIQRMTINSVGDVGIGTATPGGQLELSLDEGRKPGTNTWTVTSDARLKDIKGPYEKGLDEVLQLEPITYYYKDVGERQFEKEVLETLNVGFSAQEVQKIFPEAVGNDKDGYLNFNMHAILVAYTNAIKEQQQVIEELKLRDMAKTEKITELETKLNSSNKDVEQRLQLLEEHIKTAGK